MHKYTQEQREFIVRNVKGRSRKELTRLFNNHFELSLGLNQITAYIKNHNLNTGLTGRFTKGQKAWNKGMKGIDLAGNNGRKTQFKKGQPSINYRPVGSERVDSKDGYLIIKVSDEGRYQDRWKLKHRVVWEKHNGPIPENHTVVLADGNKQNVNIENLVLVHRGQLSLLNKQGYINGDPDLLQTGLKLIGIDSKIYEFEVKGDSEKYKEYLEKAKEKGISESTFIARLKRKWTLEQAAFKPLHSTVNRRGALM